MIPETGPITEDDISYYTEGYCWSLAWYLAKRTNGDIVTFAYKLHGHRGIHRGITEWIHVAVRVRRGLCLFGGAIHDGDPQRREKIDKGLDEMFCGDDECAVCKAFLDDGDPGALEKKRLKYKERKKLPDSAFALPGRQYPIHDKSHARNALARVSQNGTPEEKAKVRAAVHRRYPDIDQAEKGDGTTFSGPNPHLASLATQVGAGTTEDGDAPGSPAWEAIDSETAEAAALALMGASELIRTWKGFIRKQK